MRILFEGSAEQVKNLLCLIDKEHDVDLPEIRDKYALEHLWHASDVRTFYDCSDEEAILILNDALSRNSVDDEIYRAIENIADEMNLIRIGDAYSDSEAILMIDTWFVTDKLVSKGFPQLSLDVKDALVFNTFADAMEYAKRLFVQCTVYKKF